MMSIDDVVNEDVIAARLWGVFTAWNVGKLFFLAASDPTVIQLLSPIVGTICGAVIGYRHVQNLATISRERLERDKRRDEMQHELEMAKLGSKPAPAVEISSDFPFDRKETASPSEDTVDMP